ncbi:MAG: hypothetical protein KDE15_14390 [Erythrobacter sp.]|nr:hypothetical protein [Erythrobacter sp.]
MNQALDRDRSETTAGQLDWRKKVSDHVAFGLLVYTGLHIFGTMSVLKGGGGSILPYLALVILVAAVIPACRWFEQRWESLGEDAAHDPAIAPLFRREVALMWLAVFGLPLVLTLGFKGIAALL